MCILPDLVLLLHSLIQYLSTLSKTLNNSMGYLVFRSHSHRESMFRFVLVELLLVCSCLFIGTVTVLQVRVKEACFDLGAKGGEVFEVYYLVSGPISQF